MMAAAIWPLTLSVRSCWQSVDLIRHRNCTSLQHLVIKLLLFKFCKLVIQLCFIDRFADRSASNSTGNLFSQSVLFPKLLPNSTVSNVLLAVEYKVMYIVSSTLSMLSFPCICAIALPAFSIAARVSLLIFAASIEYICCSRVDIWADVCSSVCSCCFFRFNAALAAVHQYS